VVVVINANQKDFQKLRLTVSVNMSAKAPSTVVNNNHNRAI
jgi:hypothetical protein